MITPSKTMSATFPYRIEEKVGAGGMGIVYRAFEPALNRKVAIKVLRTQIFDEEPPAVADEYRRRFVQEARAAAALSHPGATTIYRVGEEDGSPYIAMEWLDGQTLEDLLAASGPMPHGRVAQIGVELLETLEAAHRAGVVHRDIKPSNLIVLKDGRLKVTDFGIARVADSDLVKTGTGTVLATPQFASPEQLEGMDVDGRSDLFSSGVVLYLALTGRFPFDGRNFFELMAALARSEAAPLRQYNPAVPEPLERAVMWALRREASERPASAAELAATLRPFAGGAAPSMTEAPTRAFYPPAPDTIRDPVPASYPTVVGVPRAAQQAVVRVVESWAPRNLGSVATAAILARLLERPLHTAPFAGGVFIGGYCLLVFDGCIVGAVDAKGRTCDEVCEMLPDEALVVLHPAPEGASPGLVPLLATLLHPPKVRTADLDTSIVNLPALAARLAAESFDGILRIGRDGATGFLFFERGAPVLSLFSDGWDDFPVTTTWESWMSRSPIAASLEEKVWIPAQLSYRKELKDLAFWVAAPSAAASAGARLKQTFLRKTASLQSPGAPATPSRLTLVARPQAPGDVAAMEAFYSGDPAYRFLQWSLEELPAYFQERDRSARWKYLVEWIPLVRRAVLHHTLPRPDQWEADFFDLVTFDASDKVLHVGHRVPRGTPEALTEFVERVVAAKKARTKTGDVGGAFLIAPQFDESMIEAYQAATKPQGTGLLSVEEKLTKYEGFIRMGPRRGFHLLLVAEKPTGFEPLLLV